MDVRQEESEEDLKTNNRPARRQRDTPTSSALGFTRDGEARGSAGAAAVGDRVGMLLLLEGGRRGAQKLARRTWTLKTRATKA